MGLFALSKMKPTLSTETINIPSNVTVEIKARKVRVKGPRGVLLRDFLGEKVIRRVPMKEGVKVDKTGNKDEIALEGNSIENVGSSASLIHQVCMVKRKDICKFHDGVYVG